MATVETMNDYAIAGGGYGRGYGCGLGGDIVGLAVVAALFGGGFGNFGNKNCGDCAIGCRDLHQTQDAIIDEVRDDFNTLNITMNQANYANQAQFAALNSKIDQTKYDLSSKIDSSKTEILSAIQQTKYDQLQQNYNELLAKHNHMCFAFSGGNGPKS